jgi:Zn-dependent peptidase ImmA (M78 family)/DNA-binding XRE family transcriptional regulator
VKEKVLMNGNRLKLVRLARGFSLEELSAEVGRMVTRQALWKYEQGKAQPSSAVLAKLASALRTPAAALWQEPTHEVRFIAYRKGSGLLKRDQERVEAAVALAIEERLRLREKAGLEDGHGIPQRRRPVASLEDAEETAEALREHWALGIDPIASVTGVLEDHGVHVIQIEAADKFDGISAIAYNQDGSVAGAAVVTRQGIPGERQRLDLAHELGHLVLDVSPEVDEEKMAFRFGGAFLAPAEAVRREVGSRRRYVQLAELRLLKRRFGMSLQALLRRLRDLDIITESHYRQWCIDINRLGYRKDEPDRMPPEQSVWLRRTVLRATAEGQLGREEAERMLGETIAIDQPLSLARRRELMKLPLAERRRVLAEQAARVAAHYDRDTEWRELQGGDIIDD